jgi:methanogenic corrinoid protein MtbC1
MPKPLDQIDVSPKELGLALGMSESTIKRWVDQGLVPSKRTVGGHRRIAAVEALRAIRAMNLELKDPAVLGLHHLIGSDFPAYASPEDTLLALLKEGNERHACQLLTGEYLRGRQISDIGDQLIRPAMQVIGLNAHHPEKILIEHRATQILLSIIQLLRQLIIFKTPHFTAVAGSVEGDVYLIPCGLVCAVIENAGGTVTNLGANTPTSVFLNACQEDETRRRLDLLSISISTTSDPRSTSDGLNDLIHTCNSGGIKVAIGGRCIGDLSLDPLPCLSIHTSLASFHQEISTLTNR